jgi:hypothetical protein
MTPRRHPRNHSFRIERMRDPGAQSATAPTRPAAANAPVHGAQAKPAHAGARRLRA